MRDHEFHYATNVVASGDHAFALFAKFTARETPAGSRRGRVTGSFFHVIAEP
jgi:cobyrinic acid a,c-diamide synthase